MNPPAAVMFGLLSVLTLSCAGSVAIPDRSGADILWLPAEAVIRPDAARPVAVKNGRSVYVDGSSGVAFAIDGERQQISDRLVQHFAREGWRQRDTQLMNPQIATSFAAGWESDGGGLIQMDPAGRAAPQEPYLKWQGEWEDARGDMVSYGLGGQGRQLYGYASSLPHDVVVELRRKLGR